MKIILSTYNFYPFHKGGTEVYTRALALWLMRLGHEVLIIAALDEGIDQRPGALTRMDDVHMKAVQYDYEGMAVLGVQLKQQQTDDIYASENAVWTTGFRQLLTACGWESVQHIILNGLSTVSGLSLCNAAGALNPSVKIDVIVHTAFICPKADLIHAKTRTRCQVHMSPAVCAACMISDNAGIPYSVSRALTTLIHFSGLQKLTRSTGIRLQSLLKRKMNSFEQLNNKAHKWVVFSEDMKRFMDKQSFISPGKVMVLRHGVDTTVFRSGAQKPSTIVTFLYAGRFEPIKGIDTLADAWLMLPDDAGTRKLYLAGNWNESTTGKKIKTALANRKDVVFISNLSQQELAQQYRNTHCVIIPSKVVETGPMVFHEAVACGCDVISSDIGGQGELAIVYKDKALSFETGNSQQLFEAILQYKPSGKESNCKPMSIDDHFEYLSRSLMIA
jgi:glycosyltransferase involved in cell wall biosynthesis